MTRKNNNNKRGRDDYISSEEERANRSRIASLERQIREQEAIRAGLHRRAATQLMQINDQLIAFTSTHNVTTQSQTTASASSAGHQRYGLTPSVPDASNEVTTAATQQLSNSDDDNNVSAKSPKTP